jgi:hypothetical protein
MSGAGYASGGGFPALLNKTSRRDVEIFASRAAISCERIKTPPHGVAVQTQRRTEGAAEHLQ